MEAWNAVKCVEFSDVTSPEIARLCDYGQTLERPWPKLGSDCGDGKDKQGQENTAPSVITKFTSLPGMTSQNKDSTVQL